MAEAPTIDEVRQALSTIDFPMSKEDLVACVEANGASDAVARQIRALPLADYGSVDEVLRSVDMADAPDR